MKTIIMVVASVFLLSMGFAQSSLAKDKEIKTSTTQVQERVNINKADAKQLAAALKGVGLKKAQAIIEYRNQYGDFQSINELTAVKGIGEKTLEKNRAKIGL